MKFHHFLLILIGISLFSCSKKEEEAVPQDPITGTWYLRAVHFYEDNRTVDVSNEACFRDTRLEVGESELLLHVSLPSDGGNCQTNSFSSQWVNENGTYYLLENGERQAAIVLNDDNQTLQLNAYVDGEPAALIFRK